MDEKSNQRRAAQLIGAIYLVAMAASMWAQSAVRGKLIVAGDATATAANITANMGLFRTGLVVDLLVCVSSLVLTWAFFVLLAPVDRLTALLGVWLRLVEVAMNSVAVLMGAIVVHLLSGGAHLGAFEPDEVAALARVTLSAQGQALSIVFLFLGLGSAVFAMLLWRSRYVPRALAGLGVVASLMLAAHTIGGLLWPGLRADWMAWMAPMFLYEVGLGLWFLIKGPALDAPGDAVAAR